EVYPDAMTPRVFLSHVFLQEGKNEFAAEKVLRSILVRDPKHQEARHNLRVLLYNQGRKFDGPGTDGVTLADLYRDVCARPSDINEHLPTLYGLAKECQRITELGASAGAATTAFLFAQPERLDCYNVRRWPQIDDLEYLAGGTRFAFHQANPLAVEIPETDLL